MASVREISVSKVVAGQNDRKDFNAVALAELADSIREHGLAQPITVRPVRQGRKTIYEIVAGERRFRAVSQVLGWETIPAIVRRMDDEAAAAVMLAENTGRADLNPIEEAEAYQRRMDEFGWSVERVAEVAGVSVARVRGRLSLLRLVDDVKHLVAHGHFPIGHAQAMSDLDSNRQRIAIRVYNAGGSLSLSRFRAVVKELLEEQQQESLFDLEQFLIAQVAEQPVVRRGKGARVDAPKREDLPQPAVTANDNAAAVLEKHIAALLANDMADEAAVLATVYERLVQGNWMSMPENSVFAAAVENDKE